MPTYFDPDSILAGGERYALALASALAQKTPTTLFTFAKYKKQSEMGKLKIHFCKTMGYWGSLMNPVSFSHFCSLKDFDIIHCLQFKTLVTEAALLAGALFRKKNFVTDLAGSTYRCFSHKFPLERLVRKFLLISHYNQGLRSYYHDRSEIIYGGVDTARFTPTNQPKSFFSLLYVGRIFPEKGLHLLMEALPNDIPLDIVGQCHDAAYLAALKQLSQGKKITFCGTLPDDQVIDKYRQASLTVLPSLADGGFTTALESMACETPVLATRLGSLTEIVEDERTGFLITPQDRDALRHKIIYLKEHRELLTRAGRNARMTVLERFTWDQTADRCLKAYQNVL